MQYLNKPCPQCHQQNSVVIQKNAITCTHPNCRFSLGFCCPICDSPVTEAACQTDEKGDFFQCGQCKNKLYTKRIKYLIDQALMIDKKERCFICNGPTIHRKAVNVAPRCFFFPNCGGQADLFGLAQKDSLVFLDFETTGLEPGIDEIIEIGAVKIDEDGDELYFQSFVKPVRKHVDAYITKLTGITEDMLADAPNAQTAITQLLDFIGTAIIVAHNVAFDIPFLVADAQRHQLALGQNRLICTCKWAEYLKEPSKSLTALTKKYQIAHDNAHRALADAASTKELFFVFDRINQAGRPFQSLREFVSLR